MEKQRVAQFISPDLLLAEAKGANTRHTGDPALSKRAIAQLESLPGLRLVESDMLETAVLPFSVKNQCLTITWQVLLTGQSGQAF